MITPGGLVNTFAKFGKNAGTNGLAFDKNGNLFASNYKSGKISEITPDGTKSTFAKPGTTPESLGLAFDQNGNLSVAEVTGIAKISPDGTTVSDFADDGNEPAFLAFGPTAPMVRAWLTTSRAKSLRHRIDPIESVVS